MLPEPGSPEPESSEPGAQVPPGREGGPATASRLYRAGLLYTAGEGIGKGATYLILIALAALLPVRDFGYLNLFLAVSGPIGLIVALGMPEGALRFYFHDRPFPPVAGTALALIAAAGLAVTLPTLLLLEPVAGLLEVPTAVVVASLVVGPALAGRLLGLAVARAGERSLLYAAGKVAEPVLLAAVLAVAWGASAGLGLEVLLGAYVVTNVVLAVLWLGWLARGKGLAFDRSLVRPLLAYSLPLVFHGLAMTGLASFDQIIVNGILGPEATGVYAFAYRLAMAQSLIALGLSSAWTPVVFGELRRSGDAASLDRLAQGYGNLLVATGVLLALALPAVARWFGGGAYESGAAIVPLVVYAYLWSGFYGLAVGFLVFDLRTAQLTAVSCGAFALNVVLDLLLVPRFGIAAAAGATVVSYALLFAVVARLAGRLRPGVRFGRLAWKAAACAPLALAGWWWLS